MPSSSSSASKSSGTRVRANRWKFKILQTSFVVEHSCVAETLRPTGLESRDEKVCSSNSLVAERTCFFTQSFKLPNVIVP